MLMVILVGQTGAVTSRVEIVGGSAWEYVDILKLFYMVKRVSPWAFVSPR